MHHKQRVDVELLKQGDDELLQLIIARPLLRPELGIVKVGWLLSLAIGSGKCSEYNPQPLRPMPARPEYDKLVARWDLESYYSAWIDAERATGIELRQICGKWCAVGEFNYNTSLHGTKEAAVAEVNKAFGLKLPTTMNLAHIFNAHEQERGWPIGWMFDEFLS